MKHFSLFCVPQEEARDLLEQLHKCKAAQGSLEDVLKLQCCVNELQVCIGLELYVFHPEVLFCIL